MQRHRVDPEILIGVDDTTEQLHFANYVAPNLIKSGTQHLTLREVFFSNVFRPIGEVSDRDSTKNNAFGFKFGIATAITYLPPTDVSTATLPLKPSLNEECLKFWGDHNDAVRDMSRIANSAALNASLSGVTLNFQLTDDKNTLFLEIIVVNTTSTPEATGYSLEIRAPSSSQGSLWNYFRFTSATSPYVVGSLDPDNGNGLLISSSGNTLITKNSSARYYQRSLRINATDYQHTYGFLIADIPKEPDFYYLHSKNLSRYNTNTGHPTSDFLLKLPVPQDSYYGHRIGLKVDKLFRCEPAQFDPLDFYLTDERHQKVIIYDPRMKLTVSMEGHQFIDNITLNHS